MSLSPAVLDALLAAGCTAEQIVAAVKADAEEDEQRLTDKRAKDAERQRRHRASRVVTVTACDNADSVTDAPLSLPPNENNSNPPTHTPVNVSIPRAKVDPWPRPEWADPQHFADLKANRKAKRLPNTPTAYTKFLKDIGKWVDDDWPPGRVLEAIAARGWASAEHDPRGISSHGLPARQPDLRRTPSPRGERPNPCLDMLYAAEAEIRASENPEPDFSTWPPLRAISSG